MKRKRKTRGSRKKSLIEALLRTFWQQGWRCWVQILMDCLVTEGGLLLYYGTRGARFQTYLEPGFFFSSSSSLNQLQNISEFLKALGTAPRYNSWIVLVLDLLYKCCEEALKSNKGEGGAIAERLKALQSEDKEIKRFQIRLPTRAKLKLINGKDRLLIFPKTSLKDQKYLGQT